LSIPNPVSIAYTNEDVVVTAQAYDGESGIGSVTLNYTTNNWVDWTAVDMVPSANNTFIASIPRQPAGTTVKYKVTATDSAGNIKEQERSFLVRNKSSLYLTLSNTVVGGGNSIKVSGLLSRGSTNVLFDFRWQNTHVLKTVITSDNGSFEYEYTPDKSGNWTVTASWLGDNEWWNITSDPITFNVQKISTSITCNIDHNAIIIGEDVVVTGFVVPSERNLKVVVSFIAPDGTKITREVYTSSDGSYELTAFQPNLKGQWQIQSSVTEDELHQASNSNQVSLTVGDTWLNENKLYIIAAGGIAGIVALSIFLFTRSKEVVEEE
jgi:hypothetical protein